MSAPVSIQDVSVVHSEVTVLDHLNLEIAAGELLVILGPSGCGKSTLLRGIGDLRGLTGRVRIGGEPHVDAWQRLAYVFQQPRLLPWRTATANVLLGRELRAKRRSRGADAERAAELLDAVGLGAVADRPAHMLSGGEQQRVAIARALAVEPDVLLLDEPFSALDVNTRRSLRRLLVRIWQATGLTVLFVTHDVDEALEIGSRVLVLSGKPTHVLADLPIPSGHPRRLDDPEIAGIRSRILDLFHSDAQPGDDPIT